MPASDDGDDDANVNASARDIPEGAWWIQELRDGGWLTSDSSNNDNDREGSRHADDDDNNDEADEALRAAVADAPPTGAHTTINDTNTNTNNNTKQRNQNDLDGYLQSSSSAAGAGGAGPTQPSDGRSHVSALTGTSASQANASGAASGAASVHSAMSGAASVHSAHSGTAGSVHSASVAAADMASVLMELVPGLASAAGGADAMPAEGGAAAISGSSSQGAGAGGADANANTADRGGAATQAVGCAAGGQGDDDDDASLASTVFDDEGYDPYYHHTPSLDDDDDDDDVDDHIDQGDAEAEDAGQQQQPQPQQQQQQQQPSQKQQQKKQPRQKRRRQFETAEAIEEEDKWEERLWAAARAGCRSAAAGGGKVGKGSSGKDDDGIDGKDDDDDDDEGDDDGNKDGADDDDDDGSTDSESDDEWFKLEDEDDDSNNNDDDDTQPSKPTLTLPIDPAAAIGGTDAASTIAGTATVYTTRDDDVRTKRRVAAFRSILVDCLGAYVTVFHGRPGDTAAAGGGSMSQRRQREQEAAAASTPPIDILNDLPVDISVNPYVPLSVVEGLVAAVIQRRMDAVMVQRRKRNLQSSGRPPPPPRPEETARRKKRMIRKVLRALLSPEFNAFRRYTVGSVVAGSDQQQQREGGGGLGEEAASQVLERQRLQGGGGADGTVVDDDDAYSRATTRQRRRKGAIDFESENRTDIEKILYGRMTDDEGGTGSGSEKNKDGALADRSKKKDVAEEEEVRLRCGIGRHFLSGEGSGAGRNSYQGIVWEEVFANSVLQRDILQLGNDDGAASPRNRYDSHLSSLAPKDLEVNLPEAYAVRYLPLFLRRATVASTASAAAPKSDSRGQASSRDQHEVLSDPRFFQARVNVLGPYYATMFHLADWESYNVLSQSAVVSAESKADPKTIDEHFHKVVSGALVDGMGALLDRVDGERVASIVGTGAEEAGRRRRDKASEFKRNQRRPYDAMVMSFCLEVGRSLHHLGVRLGTASIDQDEQSHRDAASIEVSNYINSLKAYRAALEMLKAGESSARKSRFAQDGGSRVDNSPTGRSKARRLWEQDRDRQIFFFRDTMVSVELYLADSLTCLGYCHDVKQKDFDRALMAYKESLSLYTKHVGKHHIVVCNTLHNLGTIHVEMQNWREALRCYNECVRITKKNKAKLAAAAVERGGALPEQCVDDDLANSLRCLGKVLTELKRWNDAERCFQDALAECHCSNDTCACGNAALRTDLHSTMGNMLIQKSAQLAARWHGHSEVALLAQTGANVEYESPFTNVGSDMLVSDRALAEKNARDCFQQAVVNRRRAFLNMNIEDGSNDAVDDPTAQDTALTSPASPETHLSKDFLVGFAEGVFAAEASSELASLFQDLVALGRLSFRQKAYDEAIAHFEEARRVYDTSLANNASVLPNDFMVIPLLTLLGNTYARLGRFDDVCECLEAAADALKRREENQPPLPPGDEGTDDIGDQIGEKMEWASIHYRMGLVAAGKNDHTKAIVKFQDCVKVMEEAADYIRPKNTKGASPGSDDQTEGDGKDGTSSNEKELSADESKNSEEKKSEDREGHSSLSAVDPKVAIAVNIALSASYWAMGKSCDEIKKTKDAQKCYENGMQYYNAVRSAESKMQSFEAMEARWFHLFAEPSTLTPWGGTSSVLLNLELGDVSERLARIRVREKDNAAAIESFDMSLKIHGGLSAHGYSVYSLRDEEFDSTSFSGVAMDQKLKYCCERLLSLAPDRPDVMLEMANMQLKTRDYEAAIGYYKKAEEAAAADTNEDKTPKNSLLIADIKRRIGSTYKEMLVLSSNKELGKIDTGAKDNAIKYLDDAIKMLRAGSSSATTDNAIADASVALAEVYLLAFDKEIPGTEAPDDVDATSSLTVATKSSLDIATDHLERALNFRRKRRGDLDAEVASTLHLLGVVHLKKGPKHIEDALDALKAAFDTRKDLLSPNHLDLGETIGLLGRAHLSRNKDDDLSHALGACAEALRIQEHARDTLSEDDDSFDLSWKIASSMSSIGECHFLQGDMSSAQEAFQRSFAELVLIEQMLPIDQDSDGENSNGPISLRMNLELKLADVLCNIARINVKSEELDEALAVYNSSLQHLQHGLSLARGDRNGSGDDEDGDEEAPPTSKTTQAIIIEEAAIKMEVAAIYEEKSQPGKSIELYQWCSKIFRNNEKEPSPSLVLSLRRLGQALLRREKFEEAVTSLEEALECQKNMNEKRSTNLSNDQRVMNLNLGLLHFELAQGLNGIDDKKGALEHYRNAVSMLDELALQPWDLVSTDDREPVTETQKSLNRKLLQCYDQMKHLTPGTMTEEEEEEELYDIFHRIANLRAAFGEHEAARDLYLAVVSHQREMQGDNSLEVADLLFNLGTVYSCLEDMENAFDCHEECQLISEAIIGKDSPQLAENMLALGDISMSQEEFDDALHWFSSAERIMRQKEDGLSKADESTVAALVFKKGKCLQALGHGDNATQCFKTALDLFKRIEDLERVEVSDMMNALGNTAKVEGDLDKAMIFYRQSLHLRKMLGDELSVANTKNNIGAVFHARGDMSQAMKFFSESLESKTLLLGVDHPETARSLANVGQIFLDNNDYLKARRCFMEALRVLRSVLGVDSVEVAICLYNLGVALEEGEDFSNALKVYQEAIEIFSRNADDHITFGFALHNAGVIYSKRNKPKDAVQFLEGALDVKIASFGPDSDDTADTRYCLAGALHELGDLDEALEHYSDVLRVRVRHLGKDAIETANVLMGLGEIHKSQGELEEAISCLVEALRVKRINGTDDEEISSLCITVGALFRGVNDLESALQYFTDALEAKTYEHSAKVHLDSSLCLSLIAGCLFDQGLFREALQRYQEALEIRLLSDDDDDNETKVGALLEKIGTAQVKLGHYDGAIVALKESLVIKERGGIADDPMVEYEVGTVYHLMGKSNFALGKDQEALRCYNAAIKFFKASGDECTPPETVGAALLDKADVYNKAEELSTSMLVYKEILEAEYFPPDSWEFAQTLQRLGQSYVAEGLDEEALGVTEEAVEIFEQQIAEISDENLSLDKQRDIAAAFESFFELSMKTLGSIGPEAGEMCFRLGDAYVQMGNHEKALHWIKLGIKKQEQNLGPNDPTIATGYFNKGNCLLDLGKTAEAIAGLEDALDLAREAMGEDNEIVADTYFSLAYANQINSDYRRALELYETSRSICLDIYGQTTESMISTLAKMSECHRVMGNYDDCIDRSREALSLIPTNLEDTGSALMRADIFDNLASAFSGKGDPEEALHNVHQALTIRRQVPKGMDENQVMVARELFEMVQIHAARGDDAKVQLLNDRAVSLCQEYFAKLSIKEVEGRDKKAGLSPIRGKTLALDDDDDDGGASEQKEEDSELKILLSKCKANAGDKLLFFADTVLFYGKLLLRSGNIDDALTCFDITQGAYLERSSPKSVTMGEVHHCRGIVYALQKDYKKSLASFMQALPIRTDRLSTNHVDLEETTQFLGTIHSELGHAEKAIEYFKDAISKREARLGKARGTGNEGDEAETFLRLGRVHQEQKEYDAAKKAYEHARQLRLRAKGKDCPEYGEILFALGGLLLDMGRRELSLIRLHDALSAYESSDETLASEIADVLFTLGIAYYEQEQFSDAIDSYERCLMIRKEEGHGDHAAPCAQVLTNLGGCYFDMKDYGKAEFYHTEALHMMEKSLGQSHADVAYCWHSLGCVYLENSKESKGVSCLSKALKIQRECLDKNHIDIGNTLYMLGRCLLNLREIDRAIKSLTEALKIQKAHFGDDYDVALTHKCLARAQAKRGGGRDEKAALSNYTEAIRIMMAVGIQDSSESSSDLMACFDGAMALVRKIFGSDAEQLASLLHRRGICEGIRRNFPQAIASYAESLTIYKKIYGDRHITIGNLLFNMGVCFNEGGEAEKAIKCLAKAHDLTCEKLEEDHSDIADIDFQMGTAYKLLEDYTASVKCYERSLLILKQISMADNPKVASIMQDVGDICYSCNDIEKAERCYRECLRVRMNLEGRESANVAKTLAKLGALLRTKRDYAEALRCFEDSLVVRVQLSAKETNEIASSYFDLGSVHDLLNADKKAIFCYSESIRMHIAMDSEPQLSVAKALSNKAAIVMSKEDNDQRAMHIYQRALDVRRACLGPAASERPAVDLADIIWGQASIYDRMGEHEQALSYYEKCLACYQESVGHESSQVARCIQSISDSFLRGGHYTQAHDAVVEALRLREAIPGVPEEDIADSMLTLGTILFVWREYENALPYLERACSILMRIRGKFHIGVGSASYLLGAIYESMQDYEKAMARLKDSLNARKRALGEDHIDVAKVLTLIGKVHDALGESDSAVLCFEDALEIAKKVLGPDSEEVTEYVLDLAAALVAEDETDKAKACIDDALRTFKTKQISNHVGVAKCSSIKAMIYEKNGNLDAAREWYTNSIKILDSLLPDVASKEFLDDVDLHDDYLELASTLFKFANVDDMLGDEREAINLYHRSIHLYRSLQGEDHLNVANAQYHMAIMLGRHEQFEKAMGLLQDALRIRVKNLGKDHPEVASCLFAIGVAHDKNQEYEDAILTYQECMRIQKLEYGPESLEVATTLENYGIAKGNSNDLRGAVESWEEGLEIMMSLGYDETNPLIINLAGHREIALLLLGESKADKSEGAK